MSRWSQVLSVSLVGLLLSLGGTALAGKGGNKGGGKGKPPKDEQSSCAETSSCNPVIAFQFVSNKTDRVIKVADADGSNQSIVAGPDDVTGSDGAYQPGWSPDGTKIAFANSTGVYVQEIDRSTASPIGLPVHIVPTPEQFRWFNPSWDPLDEFIAFSADSPDSPHQDIYLVAPDGSGLVNFTDTPLIDETDPAFSPDGTRLAIREYDDARVPTGNVQDIVVFDLANPGYRKSLVLGHTLEGTSGLYDLSWAKQGNALVFKGGENVIYCIDPDFPDEPVKLIEDSTARVYSPSFSSDDTELVFERDPPEVTGTEIVKAGLDYAGAATDCPVGVLSSTAIVPVKKRAWPRDPDYVR